MQLYAPRCIVTQGMLLAHLFEQISHQESRKLIKIEKSIRKLTLIKFNQVVQEKSLPVELCNNPALGLHN